jgi:hypothetical protein
MNVFNRLVMILLLLALIVLAVVIAAAPEQSMQVTSIFFGRLQQDAATYKSPGSWALFAAARGVIGGAVVLLSLILLWLELRRPRRKTIRVEKVAGGDARITTESIAQRLAYNIDQLPDVVKVTPTIIGRSRGMDVSLVLETSPDIDVPMKTEEVLQVTKEVVEERLGLRLGKVEIKIKHAPYPRE